MPPTCHRHAANHRASVSGFTLLESLAVLFIFMILLGMALYPAARWHRQQRIRSGIAVLRAALNLAREQAMTRNQESSVRIQTRDEDGTLRTFYWISGQDGDLGITNRMPDGIGAFFLTFASSSGYDEVTNFVGLLPVDHFHHAVCIGGDPEANGEWALFTTQIVSASFTPYGTTVSGTHVGLAELSPPRSTPSLTGMVTITCNTGYITTDPRLP